jgi:hypothetical protein
MRRRRARRVIFWLVCASPLLVIALGGATIGVLELQGAQCTAPAAGGALDGGECNRLGDLQFIVSLYATGAFLLSLPAVLVAVVVASDKRTLARQQSDAPA